jgi:hypothetical protein
LAGKPREAWLYVWEELLASRGRSAELRLENLPKSSEIAIYICRFMQNLRRSAGKVGDDEPDGFTRNAKLLCDQSSFLLTDDNDIG